MLIYQLVKQSRQESVIRCKKYFTDDRNSWYYNCKITLVSEFARLIICMKGFMCVVCAFVIFAKQKAKFFSGKYITFLRFQFPKTPPPCILQMALALYLKNLI